MALLLVQTLWSTAACKAIASWIFPSARSFRCTFLVGSRMGGSLIHRPELASCSATLFHIFSAKLLSISARCSSSERAVHVQACSGISSSVFHVIHGGAHPDRRRDRLDAKVNEVEDAGRHGRGD